MGMTDLKILKLSPFSIREAGPTTILVDIEDKPRESTESAAVVISVISDEPENSHKYAEALKELLNHVSTVTLIRNGISDLRDRMKEIADASDRNTCKVFLSKSHR